MGLFGLGKGDITVQTEKLQYTAGETIQGTVTFQLKKPTFARAAYVELYAMQKNTNYSAGRSSTQNTRVWEFRQPLDGEKEYVNHPLNYKFSMNVPAVTPGSTPEGTLGTVMKVASFLGKRYPVRWYLKVGLDIPKGFDFTKKIRLHIS